MLQKVEVPRSYLISNLNRNLNEHLEIYAEAKADLLRRATAH